MEKAFLFYFLIKKSKLSYILIAHQLKHFKSFLVLILMVMTEALFTLVRFRNYLRLLYTTESACHITIHLQPKICIGRFPII